MSSLFFIFFFSRLHFRPKTPPPDYESPCDMLLSEETFFNPSANPFSMEIQTLDAPSSTLLDTSTFVSDPFSLDQLDLDTRQPLVVSSTLNTLIPSVSSDNNDIDNLLSSDSSSDSDFRTIGCSNFSVNDLSSTENSADVPVKSQQQQQQQHQHKVQYSSTSASPKINNVNTISSSGEDNSKPARTNTDVLHGNTNGLLTQFCFDGTKSKFFISLLF